MRTPANLALTLALATAPLLVGCGADDSGASSAPWDNFGNTSDTASFSDAGSWSSVDTATAADTWGSGPADTAGDAFGPDLPPRPEPEAEVDFDLRTPEAGATYLYIPSAGLDALVVVDATSLAVHLVEVGVAPTQVRALPGDEGAVVLNSGSSDVSVVRPAIGGAFDVTTLDVLPGHNRMRLSPDGEWAFLWFDPRVEETGGFGSLQDVSVVHLARGQEIVYNLVVGPRPEAVRFADDGRLALFFCDNGISGVRLEDLTGDTFLPPVRVHPDPFHEAIDREIAVTPDGRFAVVRDLSMPELTLVDLETTALAYVPLDDWPSDLDLTPDGATAIVPMKGTEQVALVTVPDAFLWTPEPPADDNATAPENPYVVTASTGAPFGAAELTADGARALLYTTEPGTSAIGMVDLATAQVAIQPQPKEVAGVLVSPDGRMAALLHRKHSGDDPDIGSADAYSLLDLDSGFSKIVIIDNPVDKVIFTDDSAELFVLMPDPANEHHLVHRVSTRSFAVIPYAIPAAPVFVGAMPSVHKVAIALDDPTGWITFIDTQVGAVDQVNSFELNSFIE